VDQNEYVEYLEFESNSNMLHNQSYRCFGPPYHTN